MRIEIDIPEEEYQMFETAMANGMGNSAMKYILHGIPIPDVSCNTCMYTDDCERKKRFGDKELKYCVHWLHKNGNKEI